MVLILFKNDRCKNKITCNLATITEMIYSFQMLYVNNFHIF